MLKKNGVPSKPEKGLPLCMRQRSIELIMHGPLKVTLEGRIKGFGTLIRLLRLINTCQKFFLRQGKKVHDCHKLDFKYFTLCEILGLFLGPRVYSYMVLFLRFEVSKHYSHSGCDEEYRCRLCTQTQAH